MVSRCLLGHHGGTSAGSRGGEGTLQLGARQPQYDARGLRGLPVAAGHFLYDQENNNATWALTVLNMFLHDAEGAVIRKGDIIVNPQFTKGSDLRTFDFRGRQIRRLRTSRGATG